MASAPTDKLLVDRIRSGDAAAWKDCIARYEGRLIAFAESRLRNRTAAEDVVQETFVGFLTALANYDDRTPLEAFLFAITAHKLTDALRRSGRRPAILASESESENSGVFGAKGRPASSMMQSQERRANEEEIVAAVLQPLIAEWAQRGNFERLKCAELLFVKGLANREAAIELSISEQDVANHKHFIVSRLRAAAERARLSGIDWKTLGID
jgi:RNA polymerase sigma-70 factor (ECF subfamily)